MKTLIAIILSISTVATAAEFGYLYCQGSNTVSKSIILHPGDTFTPLASKALAYYSDNDVLIKTTLSDGTVLNIKTSTSSYGSDINRTICGPCTVAITRMRDRLDLPEYHPGDFAYCSYRIDRAANTALSPANVISLPADANGNMQVIVETSTDLLEWQQVYSFTHNNAEGTGRFFRTRIIQTQ